MRLSVFSLWSRCRYSGETWLWIDIQSINQTYIHYYLVLMMRRLMAWWMPWTLPFRIFNSLCQVIVIYSAGITDRHLIFMKIFLTNECLLYTLYITHMVQEYVCNATENVKYVFFFDWYFNIFKIYLLKIY